jgi:UDP-glucose 4-epimerase
MRIAVTGAAGFVGSHIVERLVADGHECIAIDNLSSGTFCLTGGGWMHVEKDLREPIGAYLRGCHAIVHAAAYANLRHWTRDADERRRLYRDNVDATTSLLEQAPAVPIVYLGTCSVYGSRPGHVSTEDDATPATCESWYAASKIAGEYAVAAWAQWKGVPWHVLRLVNVVGARTHRGVLSDFVAMMRRENRIHAADDGRQSKSWVHVQDVAEAVARMVAPRDANAPRRNVPPGVYNCTSAERVSWWDLVDEMGVERERVTFEKRVKGAVGDPLDLHVSGEKLAPWFRCERSVRQGVHEALDSMGWERARDAERVRVDEMSNGRAVAE